MLEFLSERLRNLRFCEAEAQMTPRDKLPNLGLDSEYGVVHYARIVGGLVVGSIGNSVIGFIPDDQPSMLYQVTLEGRQICWMFNSSARTISRYTPLEYVLDVFAKTDDDEVRTMVEECLQEGWGCKVGLCTL